MLKTTNDQIAYCSGYRDALDKTILGEEIASAYLADVIENLMQDQFDLAMRIVNVMKVSHSVPAQQFSARFLEELAK